MAGSYKTKHHITMAHIVSLNEHIACHTKTQCLKFMYITFMYNNHELALLLIKCVHLLYEASDIESTVI